MIRKLDYQDFGRNRPSKEIMEKHHAEMRLIARSGQSQRDKMYSDQRERYEPYRRAMVEFYRQQGVTSIDARPARKAATPVIAPPFVPRLKRPIFKMGSIHYVDIPTATDPWASWIDPEETAYASTSGTQATTEYPNLVLGGNADGGPANGFAYWGQYFTPPTNLGINWAEAFLQISAQPIINGWTSYASFNFYYCNLVFNANIRVIVYDSNWNQTGFTDFATTQVTSVSTNNPWDGSHVDPVAFNTVSPMLNASLSVSTDNYYGVFLQLYAYVEADGGSIVSGNMAAWLPAIQYDAVCIEP
jgi:hypothetical protein